LYGTHKIKLVYDTIVMEKEIIVKENGKDSFVFDVSIGTKVTIRSYPNGARLIIDGEEVGKTLFSSNLSIGTHGIKLINGKKTVIKDIIVSDGSSNYFYFEVVEDPIYGKIIDIDGNIYKTVQIGKQLWMAENLKTTKYKDGTRLLKVTDDSDWGRLKTPAYCWYDNNEVKFKSPYGALYNWYAINTGKLCPANWHVPIASDWETLYKSFSPRQLKISCPDDNIPPEMYGIPNQTGFTALFGGGRAPDGAFNHINMHGYWWTNSEYEDDKAWRRLLSCTKNLSFEEYYKPTNKRAGFSVRCIKD